MTSGYQDPNPFSQNAFQGYESSELINAALYFQWGIARLEIYYPGSIIQTGKEIMEYGLKAVEKEAARRSLTLPTVKPDWKPQPRHHE